MNLFRDKLTLFNENEWRMYNSIIAISVFFCINLITYSGKNNCRNINQASEVKSKRTCHSVSVIIADIASIHVQEQCPIRGVGSSDTAKQQNIVPYADRSCLSSSYHTEARNFHNVYDNCDMMDHIRAASNVIGGALSIGTAVLNRFEFVCLTATMHDACLWWLWWIM